MRQLFPGDQRNARDSGRASAMRRASLPPPRIVAPKFQHAVEDRSQTQRPVGPVNPAPGLLFDGGGQALGDSPFLNRKSHFGHPSASVIVRFSSIPSAPNKA